MAVQFGISSIWVSFILKLASGLLRASTIKMIEGIVLFNPLGSYQLSTIAKALVTFNNISPTDVCSDLL